jgi:predicted TIM-barrel fold metal-dependent hydrolase
MLAPRIDLHVHLVGGGSSGSGCRYPRHGRYRWMVPLLVRCFGLSPRTLREDFDACYVRRLARYVRAAALDAAVLLALDAPRDARGRVIHEADAFVSPNDTVLRLAATHREFLPGVSIHPARPDAFAALDRCLEGGAALMKLIPACQNIDLLDPRHRPFWERLAEAGLPLLVHTGPEPALEELRPELGDFSRLRGPLEAGVTVIAAHCGGATFQDEFVRALPRYPRLFGDTAAFCTPFARRRLPPLLAPEVLPRLVHGSDVPAPVSALACWLRGELGWSAALRAGRCANPLQRDLRLKRALGFPADLPERSAAVLRPAALDHWRTARSSPIAKSIAGS